MRGATVINTLNFVIEFISSLSLSSTLTLTIIGIYLNPGNFVTNPEELRLFSQAQAFLGAAELVAFGRIRNVRLPVLNESRKIKGFGHIDR